MNGDRFTLDTNILIYSVDTSAGPRHVLAVDIIERAVGLASCLTLQSISEFFAACCRKRLVSRDSAAGMARAWLDLFPVVCASPAAARVALEHVLAGRASYWDGLMLATAEEAGCSAILTEGIADGTMLGAVRVINPFGANGISEAADRLLRASG
nr:PIN domain-containing protein [uncultured Rhodopila sp.]